MRGFIVSLYAVVDYPFEKRFFEVVSSANFGLNRKRLLELSITLSTNVCKLVSSFTFLKMGHCRKVFGLDDDQPILLNAQKRLCRKYQVPERTPISYSTDRLKQTLRSSVMIGPIRQMFCHILWARKCQSFLPFFQRTFDHHLGKKGPFPASFSLFSSFLQTVNSK